MSPTVERTFVERISEYQIRSRRLIENVGNRLLEDLNDIIQSREVDAQRAWHFGQHFGCLDSWIRIILVSHSSDRQHNEFWYQL